MKPVSSTIISELKAENERLKLIVKRMSEGESNWYKNLFNNSNNALAICRSFSDFPSTIVDCNEQFRDLTQRTDQQIIGKDFMDLMGKGEKRKFFVQTLSSSSQKSLKSFPLILTDGHGQNLKMEISTSFFDADGERMIIVTLKPENIHKTILQEGIEQLLTRSEQVFFGIVADDILQFDYVSFSAYKTTGYSSDQLLLNPFLFWNNCHPEDLSRLKKVLKSDKTFEPNHLIRFIRQDGQMIWLDISIISYSGKDENDLSYYAVAREVTAQQKKKRLHRKKEQYNQLIFHAAKTLIGNYEEVELVEFLEQTGKQINADRFSVYLENNGESIFSQNVFSEHLSVNDKTYLSSNIVAWQEFKDDFKEFPVLVYHSDDDAFHLKKQHHEFLTKLKVKSGLIIPMMKDGKAQGFVYCTTLLRHRRWDRTDISFLTSLSQLLVKALLKE